MGLILGTSAHGKSVREVRLIEIYVFPIKSCAGMATDRWKMNSKTGKLLFDREFALVDSSGAALRLCQYPSMGSIKSSIDMESSTLDIQAPGKPKLMVNLDFDGSANPMTRQIKVCGNRCRGELWGSPAVSRWFSEYLGVQCWLARSNQGKYDLPQELEINREGIQKKGRIGFENEAPILLLSQSSIDILNQVLTERQSRSVTSRHFRPNLVVATGWEIGYSNPEDQWRAVRLPCSGVELTVVGQCARCSMVDIDPESGMKGKTLKALAEYRRSKGQITFGIFLRPSVNKYEQVDDILLIETGSFLTVS
mmetsp:Transcript_21622/g.31560  ORF Transcript_21622/g.31560 Transcript_21622/m.31560 type:complete len:309 (-) Transcript_21622:83-1009(-)